MRPGRFQRAPALTRRRFLQAAGMVMPALTSAACGTVALDIPLLPGRTAGPAPAAWEQEWEQLVTAAKREGSLAAVSAAGAGYEDLLESFGRVYGIDVRHEAAEGIDPLAERLARDQTEGRPPRDVALITAGPALRVLKPLGIWDPIRPLLFRPDVVGDRFWTGGLEDGFPDAERQWSYTPALASARPFLVNTDLVTQRDLRTAKDLLKPRWKGRLLLTGVESPQTYRVLSALREHLGEDAVRTLLVDQQPAFAANPRQVAEEIVRGRYPAGIGPTAAVLKEFWDQGLGRSTKLIELEGASYASGVPIFYFRGAPHPNAARLFVNWALTRPGQAFWTRAFDTNSRRTDLPPAQPETTLVPGRPYLRLDLESSFVAVEETRAFIARVVQS